ncbi:ATP-binding protein [Streptococcus cristatus]|uniref:ATP-binding protein n=1 Tax=Streptococcus cristatus TaxID=45634 RepID=UPI001C836AD7|nr:ATP-binding protein [Streptococcus cristatus]MBX5324472.1 ATP-binding protein [Streptococcus cristatus]
MAKIQDCLTTTIGTVQIVDTKKITVSVEEEGILNHLKINDLLILSGNNDNEKLIGMVTKVSKKRIDFDEENDESIDYSYNFCNVTLVGTFYVKLSPEKENIFRRAVNTYPEINSPVYLADSDVLSIIMNSLDSDIDNEGLVIGKYASNTTVKAILDGNKFFQRHASIVGSTGSGKSFAVANILEKTNELAYSNIIVFDLHGEYNELSYAKQIKINSNNGLHIPLWFFNYEEIHSLFIESAEGTSSNQRAIVIKYILEKKKEYIATNKKSLSPELITADTPIPFSAVGLKEFLESENIKEDETGEVYKSGDKKGQSKTKQGQFYGKLTNLITRLQTKIDDKKYSFIFNEKSTSKSDYLNYFISEIMGDTEKIKVIDLSEVPSDILSIVIGIVTRLVYDVQFWMTPQTNETRHPLAFICDEAHLYMPRDTSKMKAVENKSLEIFEKIAKEGRKYGVSLVIVSQRPAELNSTIISQCSNIISLKITNDRDKSAVSTMLTDSLVGLVDVLPNLDVGECIVIGDSIKLPTKIVLDKPKEEPKSSTIDFWDRWYDKKNTVFDIDSAINNLIQQSR